MGCLTYSIIFTAFWLLYGIKSSLDEEKNNILDEEKRVDKLEN